MNEAKERIVAWCEGRLWQWRLAVLVWLIYVGVRHLGDPFYTSLFAPLNLAIHEAGHLMFQWLFWESLTVAGGTILQLAAPILSAWMFLSRQEDYFALSVCGVWLATNLYNVAAYVGDARAQVLPLVSVGDSEGFIGHDWNYMLSKLHLLPYDTLLATLARTGAFLTLWTSVVAGAWMLGIMIRSR